MSASKKSRRKYDFDRLSPVEVYQLVLDGKIKNFSRGTWNQPDSQEYAAEIIRYLIEQILNWSEEDIKKKLSVNLIRKYRLSGLLQTLFNDSPFKVIDAVYPSRFKEWELRHIPLNFWTKENGIKATKWLIEEKLKWSDQDIKRNISLEVFNKYGLLRMLDCCFRSSAYQAINTTYPGKFKEWEISNVPLNFWTKENAIIAIKWLIEEKLKWTDDDIKQKISLKVFCYYGLITPLEKHFNKSTFQAIDTVYPGRFTPQDFRKFRKIIRIDNV